MFGFLKKTSDKFGLPPGTLVHIGEKKTEKVRITAIDYDDDHFQEFEAKTIEECFPFKESPTVTWLNIDGIHDVSVIEKIGNAFDLHPLMLEDIVHASQRPKVEDYGDNVFIVFRQFFYDDENNDLTSEQVGIILGENFVISFQEQEGDVFDPIRERLRKRKGRIRKGGSDYLTYALLDTLVDSYFIILSQVGDSIEELEEEAMESADPETLFHIHRHRRNLILLRKSIWPLREVVNVIKSDNTALITETTDIYLRDVYDHTVQVAETLELLRDMISGLIDLNLSSASNRMNEVMKVLTLIATIFIPLTFVAGIYGMNFDNMPELHWHWGYFGALGVMVVVGIMMVIYFKSRKWM